jgi:hypothetical protein
VLGAVVAGVLVHRAGSTPDAAPDFSHVVVVVFENEEVGNIIGNAALPTFAGLARQGAVLSDYSAVAHPSLPNYLALVSGSTHGIRTDCVTCVVGGRSLADTLTAAGRTWKTYAEGLPRAGFTGGSSGRYAKKHDPFLYFRTVLKDPQLLADVVPFDRLAGDLAARRLPDFSLIVPDLCHDIHDCPPAAGDAWLGAWLPRLLDGDALGRNGVVFVVFDEGTTDIEGGGKIPAYAVGPAVRPGATSKQDLSHYSLLATIETAWHLPRLGQSAKAPPIRGIWRRGK